MKPVEGDDIDLDEALERLRREVWRRRPTLPIARTADETPPVDADLAGLRGEIDLADRVKDIGVLVPAFPRFGRVRRKLAQLAARMLLYPLKVVTADQRTYNVALLDALRLVERRLAAQQAEMAALRFRLDTWHGRGGAAGRERERQAIGRLFDTLDLNARVRGPTEESARRNSYYAGLFAGRRAVLELGCGSGAFLEACRAAGAHAVGVDSDPLMVRACEERDLAVAEADALEYLAGLEDGSLDGVFSAQFVEHLTPDELVELLRLAAAKTAPGARILIETLNPECLQVLYRWFWLDPTHQRLVHPQLLCDLLRAAGFREPEVHVLEPPPGIRIEELKLDSVDGDAVAAFNASTAQLNNLLFAGADYFVVATR